MSTFSKRFLPILVLLIALLLGGCGKKDAEGLTVVFPKLGAADCAILMTEDHTVVIDTGEAEDAGAILDVLSNYRRNTVDLLLISHYDKDHVGGAAELIDALTVHRVIGSSYPKESVEYTAYQAALSQAGLTEEILSSPETVTISDNFTLIICPPEQAAYAEDESNNASVAVEAEYGDTRMLFTGDAMEERTGEILSEFSGTFDLIKLPHHGQEKDTAALLSDAFGTENTAYIVTSSKQEPEHKKLQKAVSGTLYRTRDGDITAFSDGSTVKITQSVE
jgi:competence protein ComEC